MYFDIKKLPFKKIYNISELVDYIVNEEFRADSYEKDGTYEKTFISMIQLMQQKRQRS